MKRTLAKLGRLFASAPSPWLLGPSDLVLLPEVQPAKRKKPTPRKPDADARRKKSEGRSIGGPE